MASEGLPVEVACHVLDVSCSGYYAWRLRPPAARAVRHAWLTDLIRKVHAASYCTYGASVSMRSSSWARGIQVGHNALAMLMQRGIVGRGGARKRYGIPSVATVDDLVDRVATVRISSGPPTSPSTRRPQPDRRADLQRARDGDRATRGRPRRDDHP
jgi:putative transposase